MRVITEHHRPNHFDRLKFRLDCGREVSVEGCIILPSTLGFLEGSKSAIRDRVIAKIPGWAQEHFGCITAMPVLVKPVQDGELPIFTFIVDLICYEPVRDPRADTSSLIVCWLSDDIDRSLPELLDREICDVNWDNYAVDGWI